MFCKIHTPGKTDGTIDNKGGCDALGNYLSKEEKIIGCFHKPFFTHIEDDIDKRVAINSINSNKKTLHAKDDKFYMLSINPSQNELKHIIKSIIGKNINNFSLLSSDEKEIICNELRHYTRECMNEYAKNFNREKIEDGNNLVYFAKIEEQRKFSFKDKEVKEGKAKEGDLKPGLQLHVHVVVARMDVTQKISLSPWSNSRGSNNILNGKLTRCGFNRMQWKERCADNFKKRYNYQFVEKEYLGKKISNKMKNLTKSKIKGAVFKEILGEEMKEERKVLMTGKQLYHLYKSPEMALINKLKQRIAEIIGGSEL